MSKLMQGNGDSKRDVGQRSTTTCKQERLPQYGQNFSLLGPQAYYCKSRNDTGNDRRVRYAVIQRGATQLQSRCCSHGSKVMKELTASCDNQRHAISDFSRCAFLLQEHAHRFERGKTHGSERTQWASRRQWRPEPLQSLSPSCWARRFNVRMDGCLMSRKAMKRAYSHPSFMYSVRHRCIDNFFGPRLSGRLHACSKE